MENKVLRGVFTPLALPAPSRSSSARKNTDTCIRFQYTTSGREVRRLNCFRRLSSQTIIEIRRTRLVSNVDFYRLFTAGATLRATCTTGNHSAGHVSAPLQAQRSCETFDIGSSSSRRCENQFVCGVTSKSVSTLVVGADTIVHWRFSVTDAHTVVRGVSWKLKRDRFLKHIGCKRNDA